MAKRFLLERDSLMGVEQYIEPDEDGVTLITTGTNIKKVLDENAEMRSMNQKVQLGSQTWGHHVARIPTWLYEQWCRENPELRQATPDAQAWLLAKLNDKDYAHLRTYDGRA